MGIFTKTAAGWEELGVGALPEPGLPGIGTWATLERATGSPKRYEYPDGEVTWVAYEWAGNGSVTTKEGILESLVVGGGSFQGNITDQATGGRVSEGITRFLAGRHDITIGQPGPINGLAGSTQIGVHAWAGAIGSAYAGQYRTSAGNPSGGVLAPWKSYLTGVEMLVASRDTGTGYGNCSRAGVAVVRVPKEFDNIPSSDWVTRTVYFAEVSDGVVVAVHAEHHYGDGSVSALPQAELTECDASVQVGWDYVDGVFSSPTVTQMPADPDDV